MDGNAVLPLVGVVIGALITFALSRQNLKFGWRVDHHRRTVEKLEELLGLVHQSSRACAEASIRAAARAQDQPWPITTRAELERMGTLIDLYAPEVRPQFELVNVRRQPWAKAMLESCRLKELPGHTQQALLERLPHLTDDLIGAFGALATAIVKHYERVKPASP